MAEDTVDVIVKAAFEELLTASRDGAAAVGLLERSLSSLAGTFERAAASSRVYFNAVSVSTISAVNRELQTQLAIVRQLGDRMATYAVDQKAQLETRLSTMRAVSDFERRDYNERLANIRNLAAVEEKAGRDRFKYQEQMAPRQNIAARLAFEKQLDQEIATVHARRIAAETAAQTAQTNAMIGNLRRYQSEEARADAERRRFQEQLAPRTNIAFNARTGQFEAIAAGLAGVGVSGAVATREMGHLTAIFDELMRGNHRQVISSIGAALRDANLGAVALGAGVLGLVGVFAAVGVERLANHFGELALKERSAAAAAAMGVEDYSKLRATFELASGSSANFSQTLDMLATHAGDALTNPFSKAAGAFATMHISMGQLTELMKNPIDLLNVLRQRWNEMGDSMLRTETFRALLGRGFENLIPYLNMTDNQLRKLSDSVDRSGVVIGKDLTDKLIAAKEKSGEFDLALEGLGKRFGVLANESGFLDLLKREVEELSHATDGWIAYFNARNQAFAKAPDLNTPRQALGLPPLTDQQLANAKAAEAEARSAAAPRGLRAGGALTGVPASVSSMVAEFQSNLDNAIAAANAAGFKISAGQRVRSLSEQQALYDRSDHTGRSVASPGGSMHGLGLANDLRGASGKLTEAEWAQVAPFFQARGIMRGDQVPGRGMARESWHVEPVGGYEAVRAGGGAAAILRGGAGIVPPREALTGAYGPLAGAQAAAEPFTKRDPQQEKKVFDESIKQIEDLRKKRDSEDKIATANAEANNSNKAAAKIAVDRAAFDAEQVRQETALRTKRAAALPPGPEHDAALDSTNAQVKANVATADAIKAGTAARKEGWTQQLNTLEAAQKLDHNEASRLQRSQEMAKIQAKLSESGRGAVIMAEEQRKATDQQVTSLERAYAAQERQGNIAERTLTLNLSQQRGVSVPQRAAQEKQLLDEQYNKLNSILQTQLDLAKSLNDNVQLEKLQAEQAKLVLEYKEKDAVIQRQIRDDAKKVADAWAAPFKSAIDGVGSSFEKMTADLLLNRGTTQDIFRNFYQSTVSNAISLGGSILSKAAAGPVAGLVGYQGSTSGKGVGDVLSSAAGDWIGKQLSGLFTPQTAATTLNTGSLAANTAAIAANTAAIGVGAAASAGGGAASAAGSIGGGALSAAGGGGIFGWIGSLFGGGAAAAGGSGAAASVADALPLLAFARGGIVPSAAGGWQIPNFPSGGRPAMVHGGEMVLPQKISQWVQQAAGAGTGGGHTVNVHLGAGGTFLDGGGFKRWFNDNGGHGMIADGVRGALRSNALTPRTV